LSTDKGCVAVTWGTGGDIFTMNWMESDGPSVSTPSRRGFGSIVMEMMAERSVTGKVDLEYASSGVTWRLSCPAINALEPDGHPGEGISKSGGGVSAPSRAAS
jgi:two-component sensor histidine kinase